MQRIPNANCIFDAHSANSPLRQQEICAIINATGHNAQMADVTYLYLVLIGELPYKIFSKKGDLCAWLIGLDKPKLDQLNVLRMQEGAAFEGTLKFVSAERVLNAWRKKDE